MTVNLKRWPELSPLLDQALELPEGEAREQWLAALGEEHAHLRADLQALLAADGSLAPPTIDRLSPGTGIGPYTLERELGRGGMAVVWLARRDDRPDAPPVALKLPHVSLPGAQFVERFRRESRFLAKLDHPNIARFVDAGVDASGQQYLALEYVDGISITAYCDRGELDAGARVRLFLDVVAAVGHAHSRDIAHRDLKPSNILVGKDGKPRLLDFGVAKVLVEGRALETELTAAMGRPMTPDYASPEQLAGAPADASSDIYTLGVILRELLPGGVAPRLRRRLDEIIERATRPDPKARQPNAAALAAELEAALAPVPTFDLRGWAGAARDLARQYRAVAAIAAIMWLTLAGMQAAHRVADDLQQLVQPPLEAAQQVALVTVTPEDYRQLFQSRSPLDPDTLERLVRRIAEGRPAVIGVDIDTSHPSFAAVRARLAAAPAPLVWAREAPGPGLRPDEGVAQAIADSDDGVVRRYARAIASPSGAQRSFVALVSANAHAGPPARDDEPTRSRHIRFTRSQRLEIPAAVVLADGFQWGGRVENRVVLLGGRYDRADVHATPLGSMPGVEVAANAIETELRGGGAPPPGMPGFIAVGVLQLVVLLLLYDNFPFWRAFAMTIAWTLVFSGFLAVTGIFPAWPYALFAMFIVLANQLALELFRRQRKIVHDEVSPRLKKLGK